MKISKNKSLVFILLASASLCFTFKIQSRKIFDVHLHGNPLPENQLKALSAAGVSHAAVSSSWPLQNAYRKTTGIKLLFGLMFPCPNGKVPYSLQQCFEDNHEYPDLQWVETQIKSGKIDFLGEVLSQYYGISSSDTSLLPYYRLAVQYNLPIGIHTGSAGPNHGAPNFSEAMGNPELLRPMLKKIPGAKVWIMHGGAPFVSQTIQVMKDFPNVYTDLSAINFNPILPQEHFQSVVKALIEAGLEDRIMFGSDNNDIKMVVNAVEKISFLTEQQKEKIFFRNAEQFFKSSR